MFECLQVNFSPPVKIKSNHENETKTVLNYYMILAPFQKPTQIEFANIKIKETAVRYLTVINPHEKSKQVKLILILCFHYYTKIFTFIFTACFAIF